MSPAPIKKAVILTAGLGSRFLPMTKAIPKAMLPIIDKPIVQYLVEEAISAGIEEIIFVTGPGQEAIREHFSPSPSLVEELHSRGKSDLVEKIEAMEKMAHFTYLVQDEPKGDGHAILCAKEHLKDGPFAVLFGDEIVDHPVSALKQMLSLYNESACPILCTQSIPLEHSASYGMIAPGKIQGRHLEIQGLVEKPQPKDAPSTYAVIGKYICTAEVLTHIEQGSAGHLDGEMRLIDGFRNMLEQGKSLLAYEIEGQRYDTGNRLGLLKASIAFSMKDPNLKAELQNTLREFL